MKLKNLFFLSAISCSFLTTYSCNDDNSSSSLNENQNVKQSKISFDSGKKLLKFSGRKNDIKKYQDLVAKAVKRNMVIGTFSTNGPLKCSGLEIKQNDETSLTSTFKNNFEKIDCFTIDHKTPFDTIQNFIFCSFNRK